jgi:hypothetical protein
MDMPTYPSLILHDIDGSWLWFRFLRGLTTNNIKRPARNPRNGPTARSLFCLYLMCSRHAYPARPARSGNNLTSIIDLGCLFIQLQFLSSSRAIPHSRVPDVDSHQGFELDPTSPQRIGHCLKIQAAATNSCTFLQQPFIEPLLHASAPPGT